MKRMLMLMVLGAGMLLAGCRSNDTSSESLSTTPREAQAKLLASAEALGPANSQYRVLIEQAEKLGAHADKCEHLEEQWRVWTRLLGLNPQPEPYRYR